MTLETRRSSWIPIAAKLTVLLVAVGATSLPRERAWGADPASVALVVAGSGSNLGITRRLAEEFRRIRPDPSSSTGYSRAFPQNRHDR